MANYEAQNYIVTNGLVLNLDAGDPDSYTRSQPPYVEVLVVAGGGSGGSSTPSNGGGGGGGAGGVIYNSAYQLASAAAITVTVGAGGAGQTTNDSQGNDGSNSVFGSLTAVGGGGGGGAGVNTTGRNGGSGGGAGYAGYYNNFNSGTGTAGQGFRGGYVLANNNGGGGGGAGGVGGNTFDSRPEPGYPAGDGGLGGPGVYYSISGTSTLYSTGGNGGSNAQNTIVSGSGTTGAYGGSGPTSTAASGIVIVRYPGLPAATGGTITYLNGYTIHTFTSSGTFTPYLWNDTSGEGNNATLTNGPTFNSYQWGGYIDFDGTDDYATAPASSDFAFGTGNFTLECWVYPIDISTTYQHMIALPNQDTFALKAEAGTGNIYFYSSSFTTYGSTSGWTLTLNAWNHVMLTRVSNVAYAYLNGVSKGNKSGFNNSFSSQVLNIHNGWPGEFTRMLMGVARIYNIGLSSSQVLQNFNAQRNRFGV